MVDTLDPKEWLKRAKSNLNRAKESQNLEEREIFIEDLCFDLQQSAEKALKALLIYYGINFPKTHDISELLKILKKNITITIPEDIIKASELTPYAVLSRYPHWNNISFEDYQESLEITENVYKWVSEITNQ